MPCPKNKYRRGYIIFSLDELVYDWLEKERWVYLRDRPTHPGFILSMTLKTVRGFLKSHLISEAIDQQKEYYEKSK